MIENLEHGYWYLIEQAIKNQQSLEKAEEYQGQENLFLACTQLGGTAKHQAEVMNGWIELFATQPPIKKIWVTSRISQKLFDAICTIKDLDGLWIKWGVYPDIKNIAKLEQLEYLYLGGGGSIKDISAIASLKYLKSFQTNSLFGISDYAFLGKLTNITDLSIEGDAYSSMKKVKLRSLSFLEHMPQLIRLNLIMTKVEDHSYLPILKIGSLKYLTLPNDKDLAKDLHLFDRFK